MKAYAIKEPEGSLIIATTCSVRSEAIETYMDQLAIPETWDQCEAEGYSCVSVDVLTDSELQEVKTIEFGKGYASGLMAENNNDQ